MKYLHFIIPATVTFLLSAFSGFAQRPSFLVTETQMGPFALEMSVAQAEQITGQSIRIGSGNHFTADVTYEGQQVRLEFEKIPDGNGYNYVIDNMQTTSQRFQTSENVSVGIPLSTVQDAYLQYYIYKETPPFPSKVEYIMVARRDKESAIYFQLDGAKVTAIEVGYMQTN